MPPVPVGAPRPRPVFAEPLDLRGFRLRNRLVATAHATAAVVDGEPTSADERYWARLSRGGAAMIIAGGVQVGKESTLRARYLGEAFNTQAMPGMRRRAEAIRSGGAVSVMQLCHLGRETLGAGTFFPFVAPGAHRSPREPAAARVLTTDDVRTVVEEFRISAANSLEAGFDAIELHAAHGYLIAQFLSAAVNDRTDRYGGSVGNRVAFLAEIIEAIRSIAPDTPIGVRVSVENEAGGLTVDDFAGLLPALAQRAPFDYLNLTYGVRGYYVRDMATVEPPLLGRAAQLRSLLDCPLLLCSGFRSADTIERALTSGEADLVGMARAHIADPDVATKLLEGRSDEIRPCIACNEDCRSFEPTGLCTVNPDLAPPGMRLRPAEPLVLSSRPGTRGGRVAVIGAGPGGLECALTLAQHGHRELTVFEEGADIGGQLAVAGAAAGRSGFGRLLDFYRRRLRHLGVRIELGTAVRPADLADFDEVVWAVGAEESPPGIDGTLPCLTSSEFLLQGRAPHRVVVLDDGFGWWPTVSSVESAFAAGAREVTVVTPGTAFAGAIPAESRMQLMERLKGRRLQVIPFSTVPATAPREITVHNLLSGEATRLAADLLVTVGTRTARRTPATVGATAQAVGDCVAPRKLAHAITEGRHAALAVVAGLPWRTAGPA